MPANWWPHDVGRHRGLHHFGKSRVSDRYGRSLGAAQDLDPGIELLGERLYNASAEPGFYERKFAGRLADPVVGNRSCQFVPATSYATVIR
jgi:hypothetical protein